MKIAKKTQGTLVQTLSLKKLLTTVSALAIITGAGGDASAALYKTNGGNNNADVVLETNQVPDNVEKKDGSQAEALQDDDSLFWEHDNVNLILGDNANEAKVATLDLNGKIKTDANGNYIGNIRVTVAENSSIGSVIDSTNASQADIIVNNEKTLTLGGANGQNKDGGNVDAGKYGAIRSIKLGSGNGNAANLNISVGTDLNCTIDTAENSTPGNIIINEPTTFKGELGKTGALGTIEVNDHSTFEKSVNAAELKIAEDKSVTLKGGEFVGGIAPTNPGEVSSLVIDGDVKIKAQVTVDHVSLKSGTGTFEAEVDTTVILDGGEGVFMVIKGNVDSIQKGTLTANQIDGNLNLAEGGQVTIHGNVLGYVALDKDANVSSEGLVGGTLNINDDASFVGTDASDITGRVSINTTATNNKIHDVTADGCTVNGQSYSAVLVEQGKLEMNNATGTGDYNSGEYTVHVTGGQLEMNSATGVGAVLVAEGNGQLTINSDVTGDNAQVIARGTGNVTMKNAIGANAVVEILDDAVLTAQNLNRVHVDTTALNNKVGDVAADGTAAAPAVLVAQGKLLMGDATGTGDYNSGEYTVHVTGGQLEMNSATGVGAVLVAEGNGQLTINSDVTGDNAQVIAKDNSFINMGNSNATGANAQVIAKGDSTLKIGDVAGADALVKAEGNGTIGAQNVNRVHVDTTALNNKVGNVAADGTAAAPAVLVAQGKLVMGDATGTGKVGDPNNTQGNGVTPHEYTVHVTGGQLQMKDAKHDNALVVVRGNGELTMNDAIGVNSNVAIEEQGKLLNANRIYCLGLLGDATAKVNTVEVLQMYNNAQAEIAGDVKTLTMGDNAQTEIAGNITNIATVGNAAKLVFTGKDSTTNNIDSEGDVTVQGNHKFGNITKLDRLSVEGSGIALTFEAGNIGNTVIKTNQTDRKNNIMVNADQNIQKQIGTDAERFGNIVLEQDNLTIDVGADVFAGIISKNSGNGTVNIYNNNKVLSLGAADAKLGAVNFKNDYTTENIYANNITVDDNMTVTMGGVIDANNFTLGDNSGAVILDGAKVNANIKSASNRANKGGVIFNGDATITKDLGAARVGGNSNALAVVDFADDAAKTAQLGADIYADDVLIRKSTVQLTKDVKIVGNTEIRGTTLNLGSQALTNNGNVTVNGDNIIKFKLAGLPGAMSGGNLVVNGNFSLAANATLTLMPIDNKILNSIDSHQFTLITNNGTNRNAIAADQIRMVRTTPFQKWKISSTPEGITIFAEDNSVHHLKSRIKNSSGGRNFEKLHAAAIAGDAKALHVKTLWSKIADAEERGEVKAGTLQEAHDRVEKTNTGFHETISHHLAGVDNVIGGRTATFRAPVIRTTASAGNVTGVAAGDENVKYGAWVNPFYSRVNQGARGDAAGYKNEVYGASFGFDTRTSENMVLGAAFTTSNAYTKYKGFKTGDKNKVQSLLLSVYNMHELTDNWFMTGTATIGTSKVRNYAKRLVSTASYETAEGKYNMTSFGLKEMFGYNYRTDSATITPMVGLRYSRVNAAKYQETGTTNQNFAVATKASNKIEAIAGMSISGAAYDARNMLVTPEAHAFANYSLFNKAQRSSVKVGVADFESSSRAARASYNAGVGLKAEYRAFEYEATYDLQLADKRVGHQGAFKVRVNF